MCVRAYIVRQEPPVPSGPQNIILNTGDRARATQGSTAGEHLNVSERAAHG